MSFHSSTVSEYQANYPDLDMPELARSVWSRHERKHFAHPEMVLRKACDDAVRDGTYRRGSSSDSASQAETRAEADDRYERLAASQHRFDEWIIGVIARCAGVPIEQRLAAFDSELASCVLERDGDLHPYFAKQFAYWRAVWCPVPREPEGV